MKFRFEPPVTAELPRTLAKPRNDDWFWRRIRRGVRSPSSVLKQHDGTYVVFDYPTQQEIDLSLVTYLGGHIYIVDQEEAAQLVSAGFEVTEHIEGGYADAYPGGY